MEILCGHLSYPFVTMAHGGGIKDIKQTHDGGYIAVGDQQDAGGNLNYGIMLKTDSLGVLEWGGVDTMNAGDANMDYNGVSLAQDGGYIYTGATIRYVVIGNMFFQRKQFIL